MRYFAILLATAMVMSSGCAAFRSNVTNVDLSKDEHMRARYDHADMRNLTKEIVNELAACDSITKATKPPVLVILGVQNRTSDYVDMKNLTDSIRTKLMKTKKAKFVNAARRDIIMKEQGYQAKNATPETQAKLGKKLGAKYLMSGSFTEMKTDSARQARVSKSEVKYYKLTIELTDLETGIIEESIEKEFARKISLPLIGW